MFQNTASPSHALMLCSFEIGLPLPAWSSDSHRPVQWAAAAAAFPLGGFDPARCEPGFPPRSGCGQAPAAAASAAAAAACNALSLVI
eukprot:353535-Chlamydomonas_euryale.AAC.5